MLKIGMYAVFTLTGLIGCGSSETTEPAVPETPANTAEVEKEEVADAADENGKQGVEGTDGNPATPDVEPGVVEGAAVDPEETTGGAAEDGEGTDAAAGSGATGNPQVGKRIFQNRCVACHGADGTGMNGTLAADFVNDKTRLAKSDEVLLLSIENGVPGTTMVAWGAMVDEQQRRDVLAYIRATFGD